MNRKSALGFGVAALLAVLFGEVRPALGTNGHVLHGVGSINQSLGGAGIATSLDVVGSVTNNVSSIAFLSGNSAEFGAEFFIPDRSMYASFNDGLFAGTVTSKTRSAVIPNFGLAYHVDDRWTVAFTGAGVGGLGLDYPANLPNASGRFNPLAAPQPLGFGSIYSNYQMLQMTPAVSYRILDGLSVGVGLNVDWSQLSLNPFPATPPNASGYPSGTNAATAWGAGFTVGATWKPIAELALGASVRSPQWFGSFDWNSQYPDGTPASFRFRLDYPMIIGAGAAWTPTSKWLVAADVKWLDFGNTEGFSDKNFAPSPTGPYVRGLGWESIWSVALGVQYRVLPWLPLRVGYNWGGNPIPSNQQFFNVIAPAIVQNTITTGLGVEITKSIEVNVAYYHVFQASASGPFISNGGPGYPPINEPIPGSKVRNTLSENSASLALIFKF